MKKLIGLAGKARTGKDTCARILMKNHGFTRTALADPLKLAAKHAFGLTNDETWNDDFKEKVIPYWGLSPRQMFQRLGNDAMKPVFGDDHWVRRWDAAYQNIKDTDDVVITDIRFEHEAAHIRGYGGTILHIERANAYVVSSHISEAGIAFRPGDIRIENNSTLENLEFLLSIVIEGLESR